MYDYHIIIKINIATIFHAKKGFFLLNLGFLSRFKGTYYG